MTNNVEVRVTRCDLVGDGDIPVNVYDARVLLGCRLDNIASAGHGVATNHIPRSRSARYQDTLL